MNVLFLHKKVSFRLIFVVFSISFLVGCSDLVVSNEIEIFENTNVSYEFTSENIIESPFMEPLLEFFNGGVDVPDYWGIDNKKAFFVDIDGNGTKGIIAIRHQYIDDLEDVIFPYAKLFYLYNGIIRYYDIGILDTFFSVGFLENSRRLFTFTSGPGGSTNIFNIDENGEIYKEFALSQDTIGLDKYPYQMSVYYKFFNDEWLEITEEEYNKLFNVSNFQYINFWNNINDETVKILHDDTPVYLINNLNNDVLLSDTEIKTKYAVASEVFSWFDSETMDVYEDIFVEEDNKIYWLVNHYHINSLEDLQTYLSSIFTNNVIDEIFSDQYFLYREIDGKLYVLGASRPHDITVGKEFHEIIRINDYEIIYRVYVEIMNGNNFEKVVDTIYHDFILLYEDGLWLFDNFHAIR
ncbi:MAG: IseA DL-endopeptidase inhibitor family protein [Defluviitaleaceae bacterium]|nr:IseA DL-endopeptidase inhibitor family protein [Defluviitaleaceae bacterium]